MQTLNIIVQTTHNKTIFKEFRFGDGELKIMTSFLVLRPEVYLLIVKNSFFILPCILFNLRCCSRIIHSLSYLNSCATAWLDQPIISVNKCSYMLCMYMHWLYLNKLLLINNYFFPSQSDFTTSLVNCFNATISVSIVLDQS